MRRPLAAVAVLAVSVAACGGEEPAAVDDVAAQAERVAALLEEDADCRALEAAATLQTLADDAALDEQARAAATRWAEQARQELSCEAPDPEPRPDDAGEGEDGKGEDGKGEEGNGRGNGTKGRDEGRGNGTPEDRGDEDEDDDEDDD